MQTGYVADLFQMSGTDELGFKCKKEEFFYFFFLFLSPVRGIGWSDIAKI